MLFWSLGLVLTCIVFDNDWLLLIPLVHYLPDVGEEQSEVELDNSEVEEDSDLNDDNTEEDAETNVEASEVQDDSEVDADILALFDQGLTKPVLPEDVEELEQLLLHSEGNLLFIKWNLTQFELSTVTYSHTSDL